MNAATASRAVPAVLLPEPGELVALRLRPARAEGRPGLGLAPRACQPLAVDEGVARSACASAPPGHSCRLSPGRIATCQRTSDPAWLRALLRSLVAGIAPRLRLAAVQQAMRLGHVGDVRRRRAHAVDQPRPRIRAGVVNIARIVIRVIAWKRIHSSLWISLIVFLAPPFSPVSDAACGRKRRGW